MERNYIGINLPNMLTITIMAFLGMALVGFASSAIRTRMGA